MEFAFYKESGILHDLQKEVWLNSIGPKTSVLYTDEDIKGFNIMTYER